MFITVSRTYIELCKLQLTPVITPSTAGKTDRRRKHNNGNLCLKNNFPVSHSWTFGKKKKYHRFKYGKDFFPKGVSVSISIVRQWFPQIFVSTAVASFQLLVGVGNGQIYRLG